MNCFAQSLVLVVLLAGVQPSRGLAQPPALNNIRAILEGASGLTDVQSFRHLVRLLPCTLGLLSLATVTNGGADRSELGQALVGVAGVGVMTAMSARVTYGRRGRVLRAERDRLLLKAVGQVNEVEANLLGLVEELLESFGVFFEPDDLAKGLKELTAALRDLDATAISRHVPFFEQSPVVDRGELIRSALDHCAVWLEVERATRRVRRSGPVMDVRAVRALHNELETLQILF